MNDLHKSSYCSCFMNEAHRVKVIVDSSAKCGLDPASIASKEFVILTLYCPHHWSRSYDCVFCILECQPGIGRGVTVNSVKTQQKKVSPLLLGPKCAWAHNAHWIIRPWLYYVDCIMKQCYNYKIILSSDLASNFHYKVEIFNIWHL